MGSISGNEAEKDYSVSDDFVDKKDGVDTRIMKIGYFSPEGRIFGMGNGIINVCTFNQDEKHGITRFKN